MHAIPIGWIHAAQGDVLAAEPDILEMDTHIHSHDTVAIPVHDPGIAVEVNRVGLSPSGVSFLNGGVVADAVGDRDGYGNCHAVVAFSLGQ